MSIIEIPYIYNNNRLSFNYGQVLVVIMGERSELSYSMYLSMSYKIIMVIYLSLGDMLFTLYVLCPSILCLSLLCPSIPLLIPYILSSSLTIIPICRAYYIPYRLSMCDCFVNALLYVDYVKITLYNNAHCMHICTLWYNTCVKRH